MNWWSPVTSANWLMSSCVTSCQSLTPSSSPTWALTSSIPLSVSMEGTISAGGWAYYPAAAMPPRPLLAVDRPNLLFRAFFALPRSITDGEDRPVNALLGTVLAVGDRPRQREERPE